MATLSGAGGGIAEAFTVTPFQVIKVRLQSREHLQHYKNSLNCLRLILKEEGPRALMNGLGYDFDHLLTIMAEIFCLS